MRIIPGIYPLFSGLFQRAASEAELLTTLTFVSVIGYRSSF